MSTANKVHILIVEDEILLAEDIQLKITDMGYHVVGIANSVDLAVQILESDERVDIVLIDIVLKGEKDGIDLANTINKNFQIPFIYLTSHSDSDTFSRAKDTHPKRYILKPFNKRQVQLAIELILYDFSTKTNKNTDTEKDNEVLKIKDSLFLKKDSYFERVPLKEILYVQADNSYCSVFTQSKRFVYSTVLKKIEAELPSSQFLRTHRSYVVNIGSVNGFEGNMLYVGTTKIPVSKSHKNEVFKLFRTI